MGFSKQEYWRGLPSPSPGNLPNPNIRPVSPALAVGLFTTGTPGKPGIRNRKYLTYTSMGQHTTKSLSDVDGLVSQIKLSIGSFMCEIEEKHFCFP